MARRSGAGALAERPVLVPAEDEPALLERCQRLVGLAERAGAEQAEAFAARRASVGVRFEKGELKLVQVDEGSTLGLRAFRGARAGFASSNQASDAALERTAEDALALAALAPPDEHNRLPAARALPPPMDLADPALAALPVEEVVARATEFVARVRACDARLSLDQVEVQAQSATQAVCASTGARAAESDAVLAISVLGMAIDGADVGGFHYASELARDQTSFAQACERTLAEFTTVALGNLGAGRARSYQGPVLFSPAAFLSVFVAPLVSAASAIAVQRGRSALAGKLGAQVAVPFLTVRDDPADRALAGCTRFDREGQPAERFTIVERGALQGWLYNGYAAAVDGVRSTGHASGGARATPGLGPHAIRVEGAGERGRDALFAELGSGLYVHRFSGTVDPASGDFSGVAKSARWVEQGAIARPVRETLLSGNAFALLARILALSRDAERCSGAARAPYALVDGVSVTAG